MIVTPLHPGLQSPFPARLHRFHLRSTCPSEINSNVFPSPFTRSSADNPSNQVPATMNAAYGFQSVTSGINCAGIDGNTPLEHELFITYYAAQGVGLSVGNMHYTSGKFLPLNSDPTPQIVTELSHHIPAGDADNFSGSLLNNVALNSIGIVVSKRVVQEEAHEGKPTCVFVMRHTDYNPMTGKLCKFLLEYWCRPVCNLVKAMNIIQLGKEMSVHGYVVGKDIQTDMRGNKEVKMYTFQVEVYSISVATGHETVRAGANLATPNATSLTKGGRVRLQRATDNPSSSGPASSPTPGSSSNASLTLAGFLSPVPLYGLPQPTPENQAELASYLHQVSTLPGNENVNPSGNSNEAGPSTTQPMGRASKRGRL
ncbi:uncharacterized protein MELLADRAFT_85175 [Melampsora larici-populina 98AG31]|uniref:Uncharacterized protein n=1 Tax=Melampsora larici-populina (strain 98AG31 / pathotype 3-4-7) TaxID=747676 RepID=F4RHS6_MELLP|nr:uncharacterized protein MELLADRAFT_85175 [Melampsora larici-populina 98AG31]EGG07878.1 hypothetical protein MELLADRAFT_85175 [Melampsora larici-populina 98AG31]